MGLALHSTCQEKGGGARVMQARSFSWSALRCSRRSCCCLLCSSRCRRSTSFRCALSPFSSAPVQRSHQDQGQGDSAILAAMKSAASLSRQPTLYTQGSEAGGSAEGLRAGKHDAATFAARLSLP